MSRTTKQQDATKLDRLIPDTSVIIEGILSKRILDGTLTCKELIIHEAVINELEAQANKNRETGMLGLEELKQLRHLAKQHTITLTYAGERPTEFDIKMAAKGGIDALIREYAFKHHATLITADKVQASVAESKGITVILIEFLQQEGPFVLEQYFSDDTLSLHIKENAVPLVRRGRPGKTSMATLEHPARDKDGMKTLTAQILEETAMLKGFVEYDQKGLTMLRMKSFFVIMSRPPFSDVYEITATRAANARGAPDPAMVRAARGVLIIGSPGAGKTTWLQSALCDSDMLITVITQPHDVTIPHATHINGATATPQDVQDVLSLTRPDLVVMHELRTAADLRLFAELRLMGMTVWGVLTAPSPLHALHRLNGKIDLAVLPVIIDTIVVIDTGRVVHVHATPSGFVLTDRQDTILEATTENGQATFRTIEQALHCSITVGTKSILLDGGPPSRPVKLRAEGKELSILTLDTHGKARIPLHSPEGQRVLAHIEKVRVYDA